MANEPITREEILLNAVATGESANLEPITREEMFLAKLGGQDVETPEPITRREKLLPGIIDNGGGGSGDTSGGDIDALIEGSITEITSNATSIKSYVVNNCSALITVDFPKAITVGERAFNRCGKLQSANFPEATHISPYAFGECSSLNTINFPKVITIDNFAFYKCTAIKTGYFPSAVTINSSFSTCISLETVDFSVLTEIGNNAFQSCSKLKSMIIRNNNMCNLVNSAAFSSTPIASGTGYIYVPRALVDSYKSATNWSTYANQFRALEDYTVDGTITGELDESKI